MRIDCEDLGIEFCDVGPWRSYQLSAEGETLEELLSDAWISEVDQDGEELRGYLLEDASPKVAKCVESVLSGLF